MRVPYRHCYTYEEYLALERGSEVKHEYLDGEIFAMAGGTPDHAALQANVIGQLFGQLASKPCRAFTSDLCVRVEATGLATYPDASVICGELNRDPKDPNRILNPTLLVEVTSPSSEDNDRGAKFEHYRQIRSLREYVVVSHREKLIEVFRRLDTNAWDRFEARAGSIGLESIGASLDVALTYARVEL